MPEKLYSCRLVPAFLHQNIRGIFMLLDSQPEIMQRTTNVDKHFVKKPGVAQSVWLSLQHRCLLWHEPVAP